jgi:hypothetical protein
MNGLCGKQCACKVVNRGMPLSKGDIAVMLSIKTVLERCSGMTHSTAQATQSAMLAILDKVKCRQPRWAHLLSLPIRVHSWDRPITLLFYSATFNLGQVVSWLLDQGVCLYAGLVEGAGWKMKFPRRRPAWSKSVQLPLFVASPGNQRLLLQAGAHPFFRSRYHIDWKESCTLRGQWCRWHGRSGRRVAVKMLMDSFTA